MECLQLQGKVVLVTGGNRGIGLAIVTLLKECGAQVAYTYRSEPNTLSDTLALQADVTNPNAMAQVVEQIEENLGPIYGVVANAGITRDNFFPKLTSDDWDAVISTNLKGIYNTLFPIIPKLYERQSGSVVCISSISGERGNLGQTNYAASKAGVIGLTKALALEGARYGVRVNAVTPGFIETEMTQAIPDKVKEKLIANIPLRRFGNPQEVAWGVVFLLSPVASSYISGTVVQINGGYNP
jgi:acetoacetyl-CoA reductase/3-oxoacyl-[acyl-carrier protein] reductase